MSRITAADDTQDANNRGTAPMSEVPEIQVTLLTERYMGDHAERVRVVHSIEPDETVVHLLMRLMQMGEFQPRYRNKLPASDWIELRYVEGTAPEVDPGFSTWDTKGAPF